MRIYSVNAPVACTRHNILSYTNNNGNKQILLHSNTAYSENNLCTNKMSNFRAANAAEIHNGDSTPKVLMQTSYPYESKSLKDDYTALYTTLMLIFLTGTFHSEKSGIIKDEKGSRHNLLFTVPEDSDISTPKEGYRKQQELFRILYENDYTPVLEGIKQTYTEILEEDYESNKISHSEKLQQEEIINSISYDDIKNHIKKYLLDAKPEININANNINPAFQGKIKTLSTPVRASFPVIICISISERAKEREKKIVQEAVEDKIDKVVTKRTKFNTEQLKRCGIKDKDIDKYLTIDGHPNEEGKKILKEHHLSFQGTPHDGESIGNSDHMPISDLSDNPSIEELANADISLPAGLQEFVDIPAGDIDSGLMSDIMAELPDGFTPDTDLLSNLKEMTGEILDMMG